MSEIDPVDKPEKNEYQESDTEINLPIRGDGDSDEIDLSVDNVMMSDAPEEPEDSKEEETITGTCIICGQEGELKKTEICLKCADRFKNVTESSSSFSDLMQQKEEEPKEEKVEPEERAITSRILMEFGQSESFKLRYPFSVAIDDGSRDLFVMDRPERGTYRVSRFTSEGKLVGILIECPKGDGEQELSNPKGIAIDGEENIFVPDAGNDRIQLFDRKGKFVKSIGKEGEEPGEFSYPCDVDVDELGLIYVTDTLNCRIQKLNTDGVPLLVVGGGEDEDVPELNEPTGITTDQDRNIVVVDTNNNRVVKYDSEGNRILTFGEEGEEAGRFSEPSDVRVGKDGTMFIADKDNYRIQQFAPDGKFMAEFSLSDTEGSISGGDIAIDDDGCVWVCNTNEGTVMRVELLATG